MATSCDGREAHNETEMQINHERKINTHQTSFKMSNTQTIICQTISKHARFLFKSTKWTQTLSLTVIEFVVVLSLVAGRNPNVCGGDDGVGCEGG